MNNLSLGLVSFSSSLKYKARRDELTKINKQNRQWRENIRYYRKIKDNKLRLINLLFSKSLETHFSQKRHLVKA